MNKRRQAARQTRRIRGWQNATVTIIRFTVHNTKKLLLVGEFLLNALCTQWARSTWDMAGHIMAICVKLSMVPRSLCSQLERDNYD